MAIELLQPMNVVDGLTLVDGGESGNDLSLYMSPYANILDTWGSSINGHLIDFLLAQSDTVKCDFSRSNQTHYRSLQMAPQCTLRDGAAISTLVIGSKQANGAAGVDFNIYGAVIFGSTSSNTSSSVTITTTSSPATDEVVSQDVQVEESVAEIEEDACNASLINLEFTNKGSYETLFTVPVIPVDESIAGENAMSGRS